MVARRRPNRGNHRPPSILAIRVLHLARCIIQHAQPAEHAIAARRREDDDPTRGALCRVTQDLGKVVRERLHDTGAVDDGLGQRDANIVGQARIGKRLGDNVAAHLADEEEQRWLHGPVAIPVAVVVENVRPERSAVARVRAEYLQRRRLRNGLQGSRGGWTDRVDGYGLKMRPCGIF